MIHESYRHILSNEPTEYVHEGCEKRLEGRCDLHDTVRLDTLHHAIQASVAAGRQPQAAERRMVMLGVRERPRQ